MAVATTLLLAALAAAGCGLGPGAEVGSVRLTVTREYGATPVLRRSVAARESDTVMRVLESSATIATRYGGGFVHSIDGVAEAEHGGRPHDWFFYVDGVESPIGAADYEVEGGERIWWDYRDWSATNHVPAVVGQWPAPFAHGVGGRRYEAVVECLGEGEACQTTREALEAVGPKVEVLLGASNSAANAERAIRVLVGPWAKLREDATARLIEAGPAESGVFADFASTSRGYELVALSQDGAGRRRLGPDAGLVAATSRYDGPPVWVVTGGTPAAVRGAADALDTAHLRDHYAVAIEDGKATTLPLEGP